MIHGCITKQVIIVSSLFLCETSLSHIDQSLVFITILLFTVAYIFAIVGVIFFDSYTSSSREDLLYRHSFRYYCTVVHTECLR